MKSQLTTYITLLAPLNNPSMATFTPDSSCKWHQKRAQRCEIMILCPLFCYLVHTCSVYSFKYESHQLQEHVKGCGLKSSSCFEGQTGRNEGCTVAHIQLSPHVFWTREERRHFNASRLWLRPKKQTVVVISHSCKDIFHIIVIEVTKDSMIVQLSDIVISIHLNMTLDTQY